MIGLTPCFFASLTRVIVPASEPWSVSPTAGISNSAARAASSGIRHAPSRIENSEWTCRWTKSGEAGTGKPLYKWVLTGPPKASTAGVFGVALVQMARDDGGSDAPRNRVLDPADVHGELAARMEMA